MGEDAVLQGPVARRRPLGRAAPGRGDVDLDQAHDVLRRQEVAGQFLDAGQVEAAGAQGGDGGHDVGLAEPGLVGAQARLGVDEVGEDLVAVQARVGGRRARAPDRAPCSGSSRPTAAASAAQRPRSRSGVKPWSLRSRVSRERGLVGPHPLRRAQIPLPRRLQVGLDLDAALGERAQLLAAEPDHLPRAVAVRAPRHPQALGQGAPQLVHGRSSPPPWPSRAAGWRRRCSGCRRPARRCWGSGSGCAAGGRRPGWCGARRWPPRTRASGPGGGRRRPAGGRRRPWPPGSRGRRWRPRRGPATPPSPPPAGRTPTAATPTWAPTRSRRRR